MANSVDPDQTAPIGAVCSGSTLFASILNLSVMLGNYLQQPSSADDIFRCIFFLGPLRVKLIPGHIHLLPAELYLIVPWSDPEMGGGLENTSGSRFSMKYLYRSPAEKQSDLWSNCFSMEDRTALCEIKY